VLTTTQAPPDVYDRLTPPGTVLPDDAPPAKLWKRTAREPRKDDDGILLPDGARRTQFHHGVI
jgi:hypothetical protein